MAGVIVELLGVFVRRQIGLLATLFCRFILKQHIQHLRNRVAADVDQFFHKRKLLLLCILLFILLEGNSFHNVFDITLKGVTNPEQDICCDIFTTTHFCN